jgi:hypothetical protein
MFPRQTRQSSLSKEAILSLFITPAVNLGSQKGDITEAQSLVQGDALWDEKMGNHGRRYHTTPRAGGVFTQLWGKWSQSHLTSQPQLTPSPFEFSTENIL